ncbi:MAG: DUF1080 domain-containing protein [Tannerella sp.]|jgi:hypothetical protein|nr:DUF1080 domain-containing protein [Tannerella sp.]
MKKFSGIIILACALAGCTQTQKEMLFNGKDLSNWNFVVEDNRIPADRVYSVQDETILIQGSPFGYMYTKKKYGNCTLEVEWRWVDEPTNSGIFLLIADPTNPFPNGIECQLHAGDAGDFVLLGGSDMAEYRQPEGQERPKFPVIKKRSESSEKPAGEWNKARIIIRDGEITVYINGVLQNVGTCPVKEGYIGLQSEGKKIAFRNVTVTP